MNEPKSYNFATTCLQLAPGGARCKERGWCLNEDPTSDVLGAFKKQAQYRAVLLIGRMPQTVSRLQDVLSRVVV
jgi:hypothetical protein